MVARDASVPIQRDQRGVSSCNSGVNSVQPGSVPSARIKRRTRASEELLRLLEDPSSLAPGNRARSRLVVDVPQLKRARPLTTIPSVSSDS